MNTSQKLISALTIASSLVLVGCGGGGSDSGATAGSGATSTGSSAATITGTDTGKVSLSAPEVSGVLTVVDPDPGQATFAQPASLAGTYGTWTFTVDGATATWRFTLNAALAPAQASSESLVVRSQDGSAQHTITVSITATNTSSALVTSVSPAVYSGNYAAEKVAVFNRLNEDRARCGFGKLAQNSLLDQAAQNHSNYIALNKIANTHFEVSGQPGFTGYDPSARFEYLGYKFTYGNENVSQVLWGSWFSANDQYAPQNQLSATNNLFLLYSTIYHLAGLMDRITEVGVGVSNFEDSNDGTSFGKTLTIDGGIPVSSSTGQLRSAESLTTFPCESTEGLFPIFRGESPDPFPSIDRNALPYGHPVYITSGPETTVTLTSGTITKRGGSAVPTTTLTAANDPNQRLGVNEVFLVPTVRLADNSTYDVVIAGTNTGMISAANPTGAFTRSFSFSTGTVLSQ
jgi:VCBS repeat-containing protein